MFLSKKLLIDTWVPKIEEKYSTSTATAASSTLGYNRTLFVGATKIIYQVSSYTRSIQIEDAANTQTNLMNLTGQFYADGDSDENSVVYYSSSQTSSNITFGKLVIDVSTEGATPTTTVKTWSKTYATIITMFGNDILWNDSASSSAQLKLNTTTMLSASGGFGQAGKPDSTSVYVSNSNNMYSVTTSAATHLFTTTVSGVIYANGHFYGVATTPTTTVSMVDNNGLVVWSTDFYADDEQTIPVDVAFLGYTNNKLYGVSFPKNQDALSPYYKLVLWEVDMLTGVVYHKYDLPTPKVVQDGLITLNNIVNHVPPANKLGIKAINRRFALPILVGYSKNYVFYHDWFVITVPE